MRWKKTLAVLFGAVAIFLFWAYFHVSQKFGDVTCGQLVWNLFYCDLTGIGEEVRSDILFYLRIILLDVAIWIVAVLIVVPFLWRKLCPARHPEGAARCCLWLALAAVVAMCVCWDMRYGIHSYLVQNLWNTEGEQEDFIAAHYRVPAPEAVRFNSKRNLVVILAESMERSFADSHLERSYTPHLEQLLDRAAHNSHMLNLPGTNWTIAALTAWNFGLPLRPQFGLDGNNYNSRYGFLPHATGIFDILAANGYALSAVIGSDARFAGQNVLLSGHGNFHVYDMHSFRELEKKGERDLVKRDWGYGDKSVLEKGWSEYERLRAAGKPFVLLVETLDTHFGGLCPQALQGNGDIRDCIESTDRYLGEFIRKFQHAGDGDTVLAVLGDHLHMGDDPFLEPVPLRTIYNAFYGPCPAMPEHKKNMPASALDIAPTLLHCAGAQWGDARFGLGVSLFDDAPTLLEELGTELGVGLEKKSRLYETFY
ncbi:MAG: sulfatase-like hydrolase/transferase [Desulfovibrio sp.]|nr:sulfatase-like hydrolase/transferase [Desulfovibrio sp.]